MNELKADNLNVMALGLRGMPNVPGGVEVHASELYPRLQALGAKITVLGRRPYRPQGAPTRWRGVDIRWLPSFRMQGVEALIHTFLGVLYAAIRRPDVLHIHAVGPWLWTPLAKLFGLRVVVTHHGQDYLREKWHGPARLLLRAGETLGVTFADECIVISHSIQEVVRAKHGREAMLIPNGVGDMHPLPERSLVEKYGLTPQRFVIQVSRLVPEKRQLDLIAAFKRARLPGWKLVLVGGAQGSQRYADLVREQYETDDSILCTGFLSPPEVQELLSHAGVFALPSSHEGLPIALLEAMKMGLPVVASDIEANLEVGLDASCYFPLGDVDALAMRLAALAAATPEERGMIAQGLEICCARYDWDAIARSTMQLMRGVAGRGRGHLQLDVVKPLGPLN
ncbi:MAG TPA: glycosyltransferase family 4 protein [Steroidobacteraceae bacterium]|jgi:glycosyltransferase involved in cell wall biosynthesis|nr:glycosyltransferase family 4 protein [Steroidobacteraceae bacterium]